MQQSEENDLFSDEVIKLLFTDLTWHIKRIQRKVETLPANDERHALLPVMFTQGWWKLEQVEQALDLQSRSDRP